MLTAALAEIIRKSQINAEIAELYPAIVCELRREGECKVIFHGHYLEFCLEIQTCDVYVDGEFADSLPYYSLVREFLEDIAEVE